MPTVEHFEIAVNDIDTAKSFYETVFGWEISKVDMPNMEYFMVKMADESAKPMMGGGMVKRMKPEQMSLNYIGVDDIDAYMKKIVENGGKIVFEKDAIPGMGWMCHFTDGQDNYLGLWMNDKEAA